MAEMLDCWVSSLAYQYEIEFFPILSFAIYKKTSILIHKISIIILLLATAYTRQLELFQ